MARRAYVAEGQPGNKNDGGGWTVVNKKTKELEARLQKKTTKKEDEARRRRETQELLSNSNVYVSSTIYEELERFETESQEKKSRQKEAAAKEREKPRDILKSETGEVLLSYTDSLSTAGVSSVRVAKQPKKKPKKTTTNSKPKQQIPLRTRVSGLSAQELRHVISDAVSKFPDKMIQQKLVADFFDKYLNGYSFEDCDDEDDNANKKWKSNAGIPYTYVPSAVIGELNQFFSSLGKQSVLDFTWFLFENFASTYMKSPEKANLAVYLLLQYILRNFPHTLVSLLPKVKEKFLGKAKPEPFIIQNDSAGKCIMNALLIQVLYVDLNAALQCWFNVLLPTYLSTTDKTLANRCVKYFEAVLDFYSNTQFKDVSNENSASIKLFTEWLIQLLDMSVADAKPAFKDRLQTCINIFVKTVIFATTSTPRNYFSHILKAPQGKKSSSNVDLLQNKLLAHCLIIDPQCVTDFESCYSSTHLWKVNNVILYLAANWDTLTKKERLPIQLPAAQLTANIEAVRKALKNFIQHANSLLANTLKNENGQYIGMKTLGVDRSTLETALASALTLQKVVSRNVPSVESQQSTVSSVGTTLIYIMLFCLLLYALYVNKKIPQHWVEEIAQYMPKALVDAVEKSKKYFV